MIVDIVDAEESAVLIDLENIRLSWEKCYRRVFRYTDLCWLCLLLERHFQTNVGRIVVFMSDPEECRGTIGEEQLNEMQLMYRYLQEDQARCSQPNGELIKKKQSSNIVEKKVAQKLLSAQEKCLRTNVFPSEQVTCVEMCPSKQVETKGTCSNDGHQIIVDLCSEDEADDGIPTPSSSFPEVSCSSSCSDSEGISDVILVTERTSETFASTSPRTATPPHHSRTKSAHEIPPTDDVEWIMSLDSLSNVVQPPQPLYKKNSTVSPSVSESSLIASRQFRKDHFSCGNKTSEEAIHSSENSPVNLNKKDMESTSEAVTSQDVDEPFTRLGQDTCPHCHVIVKTFGYKMSGRRRVQRCCDVAIGNEVTKICFTARYNSIFLFSADSDFEETARSCVETENYEGVTKYAKPIRILGFSFAFESVTANKAREAFLKRRSLRLEARKKGQYNSTKDLIKLSNLVDQSSADVSVFFVDYEFPVIRRVLNRSARPILSQYTPSNGGSTLSTQNKRPSRYLPKNTLNTLETSTSFPNVTSEGISPSQQNQRPLATFPTEHYHPLENSRPDRYSTSFCKEQEAKPLDDPRPSSSSPLSASWTSSSYPGICINPLSETSQSHSHNQSSGHPTHRFNNTFSLVQQTEYSSACERPSCDTSSSPNNYPLSLPYTTSQPPVSSESLLNYPCCGTNKRPASEPRNLEEPKQRCSPTDCSFSAHSGDIRSPPGLNSTYSLCSSSGQDGSCDDVASFSQSSGYPAVFHNSQSFVNPSLHSFSCFSSNSSSSSSSPSSLSPSPGSSPFSSGGYSECDFQTTVQDEQCGSSRHVHCPKKSLPMMSSQPVELPQNLSFSYGSSSHPQLINSTSRFKRHSPCHLDLSCLSEISSEDDDMDEPSLQVVTESPNVAYPTIDAVTHQPTHRNASVEDTYPHETVSRRSLSVLNRHKKIRRSRSKYLTAPPKRDAGRYAKHIYKAQIRRTPFTSSRLAFTKQPCFKHMKWVSTELKRTNLSTPSYQLV